MLKISAFLVSLVLLAGSAGISLYSHYCSMAEEGRITFMQSEQCCTGLHEGACYTRSPIVQTHKPCCNQQTATCSEPSENISKTLEENCCQTEKTDFRIAIVFYPEQKFLLEKPKTPGLIQLYLCNEDTEKGVSISDPIFGSGSPPGCYGRELIYFIHQPKIPLPC